MEVVWSLVELGVYRMCSRANKCVRDSLGSVEGELKHCLRPPHCEKNVFFCDVMIVTHESEDI